MIHELNYYFNQKVHFNNFTQKNINNIYYYL